MKKFTLLSLLLLAGCKDDSAHVRCENLKQYCDKLESKIDALEEKQAKLIEWANGVQDQSEKIEKRVAALLAENNAKWLKQLEEQSSVLRPCPWCKRP